MPFVSGKVLWALKLRRHQGVEVREAVVVEIVTMVLKSDIEWHLGQPWTIAVTTTVRLHRHVLCYHLGHVPIICLRHHLSLVLGMSNVILTINSSGDLLVDGFLDGNGSRRQPVPTRGLDGQVLWWRVDGVVLDSGRRYQRWNQMGLWMKRMGSMYIHIFLFFYHVLLFFLQTRETSPGLKSLNKILNRFPIKKRLGMLISLTKELSLDTMDKRKAWRVTFE